MRRVRAPPSLAPPLPPPLALRLALLVAAAAQAARPPAFVHLAALADPSQMAVQWTTSLFPWPASQNDVLGSGLSVVQWGRSPTRLARLAAAAAVGAASAPVWNEAAGRNWSWVDLLSPTNRSYTHHAAVMTGLTPGATYFYRVGTPLDGFSSVRSFRASRARGSTSAASPLRMLVFGDAGWTNFQALSYLQDEAISGLYDLALNLGDYAYDLPNMDGVFGDQYQAAIKPLTSALPMMGAVSSKHCVQDALRARIITPSASHLPFSSATTRARARSSTI
jgi:phosphodiesterase/alkaline phosphatase D-like protein